MKKLLWVLATIAIVLAGALLFLSTGRQPEPFADGSESLARLQPGPLEVIRTEVAYIDHSRPTNGNGEYPGDTVRHLEGGLWQPAQNTDGPYPLVIYSHGFSSTYEGGAYLAEQLASLGHVVISVNYPLTHMNAPGGPEVRDVINQPADVSFLIDTLLTQSATEGHSLQGMIDPERIGVTGLSLGGMTTALVSYHPTMRDSRIRAALSIAGPTAIFTPEFFSHADMPFLMLAGDIDALVPYTSNAASVPDVVQNSALITIFGASHTGFAGPAAPLRWMSNPDALGCWIVSNELAEQEEEPWYDLIGSPEQGINHNASDELCLMDPLPPAMNVLRQQMITNVVVSSFFQREFAADQRQRDAARRFLATTLPAELAEVDYRSVE